MTKDSERGDRPRPAKMRSVRIPDEVWDAAEREAERRGESRGAAIVRLLTWYADGNDPTARRDDAPFAPAPGWTLTRARE